jgi:CheY-like chemotaxis protein
METVQSTDPAIIIAGIIVVAVTPIITALVSYVNSRAAKVTAEATAASVKQISNSVDGQWDKMQRELAQMRAEMVGMREERATLREFKRAHNEVPTDIRVAILDDDAAFNNLIKEFLRKETGATFQVDCYDDSKAAFDAFMARRHDVYIVDLKLIQADGINFIRSLKALKHAGPFIILSSHIDSEVERAALHEDVQLVLSKDEVTNGSLGRHIRFAIQSFRASTRDEPLPGAAPAENRAGLQSSKS